MVHDIAIPLFYLRENSLSLRTDAIIFFRLDKPLDPGELPPIKERIRGLREELSIDEVAAEVFDAFGIGGAKFTELDCLTLPDPSAITRKMLYGRTSAKCPEQSALVKPPNPEARTEQILFGMSYCPLPTTSKGLQVMFHSAEYVANSFSRPHIAIAERISRHSYSACLILKDRFILMELRLRLRFLKSCCRNGFARSALQQL